MSILFGLFSSFLAIIFVLAILYVAFKILAEVGEFFFGIFVMIIVFYLSWNFVLYLISAASDMF